MNIFEAIFKAIGWFIKAIIWVIFTSIRLPLYLVASLLLFLTYMIAILFYPFISIETLASYVKNFRNNFSSMTTAFFAEIRYSEENPDKKNKISSEKVEIGDQKKVSVESTIVTKHSGICVACGTTLSDRIKELIEKDSNQPVFCEFCGKEIV